MEAKSNAVCRVCLTSKRSLLSMSEDFDGMSLREIYLECTGQNLKEYQDYPFNICRICRSEMLQAFKFKKKCLENEKELSERVKQVEVKLEFVEVKDEEEEVVQVVEWEEKHISENSDQELVRPKRLRRSKPSKEGDKKFTCDQCDRLYPSRNSLNAHRWYSHKLRPPVLPCKRCGKSFQDRKEKDGHECFRQCEYCGKKISGKHFAMHVLRHTNKEKNYECDLCPKKYSTPTDLSKHKLVTHVKCETTVCSICGKMVKEAHIYLHKRTHLPKKDTPKQSFSCGVCGKIYSNKPNLKNHVEKIHMGLKICKIQCTLCDMKFRDHAARKVHIYKYHLKKPLFNCQLCQKEFYQKSVYQTHVMVHHSFEKLFNCTICDKAFALDSRRKVHEAFHSEERKFTCSTCSKSFKSRSHLIRHMRGHTGEKIFTCPHCSVLFYSIRSVRGHVKRDHPNKEIPPPGTILSKKRLEKLAKEQELAESLLKIPTTEGT
ncbi:hypothetical protein DMENIID0001_060700 [Sergentomyia squamirostris]